MKPITLYAGYPIRVMVGLFFGALFLLFLLTLNVAGTAICGGVIVLAWLATRRRSLSINDEGVTVRQKGASTTYEWDQFVDYGFTSKTSNIIRIAGAVLLSPLIMMVSDKNFELLYRAGSDPLVLPRDIDSHRKGMNHAMIHRIKEHALARALYVLRSDGQLDAGGITIDAVRGLDLVASVRKWHVPADELHLIEYKLSKVNLQLRKTGSRIWHTVHLKDLSRISSLIGVIEYLRDQPAALHGLPTEQDHRAMARFGTHDLDWGFRLTEDVVARLETIAAPAGIEDSRL